MEQALTDADVWQRHEDADGLLHAVSPLQSVTVVPDGEESARLFKRHAVQPLARRKKTVLVGELNGVRVYIDGGSVVMTVQDLYPEFTGGNEWASS